MLQCQTQGVVVHVNDYGESDKIITIYSSDAGKLTGIAKGAKRSKKRFVNKLEIFSLLSIQYINKYNLPIIDQAELLNSHLCLREKYDSYTAAALLCDLIRHWTQENEADPDLFSTLTWAFDELCHARDTKKTIILFLSKLYKRMGYQPDFNGCLSCGRLDLSGSPFSFKTAHGSIICRSCRQGNSSPSVPLSINTVKLLSKAFELPVQKLSRLQFTRESAIEALNFFRYYDRYLLDRDLQSWKYLNF